MIRSFIKLSIIAVITLWSGLYEGYRRRKLSCEWQDLTITVTGERAWNHIIRYNAWLEGRYNVDFYRDKDQRHDKNKFLTHALVYILMTIWLDFYDKKGRYNAEN